MPFKKGNKLGRHGRQNPPGGRPTKEQAEINKALIEKYWVEVEKRINSLLTNYFKEKGAARDVINRLIPYAKQGIGHSGEVGVWRIDAYDPKHPERNRKT